MKYDTAGVQNIMGESGPARTELISLANLTMPWQVAAFLLSACGLPTEEIRDDYSPTPLAELLPEIDELLSMSARYQSYWLPCWIEPLRERLSRSFGEYYETLAKEQLALKQKKGLVSKPHWAARPVFSAKYEPIWLTPMTQLRLADCYSHRLPPVHLRKAEETLAVEPAADDLSLELDFWIEDLERLPLVALVRLKASPILTAPKLDFPKYKGPRVTNDTAHPGALAELLGHAQKLITNRLGIFGYRNRQLRVNSASLAIVQEAEIEMMRSRLMNLNPARGSFRSYLFSTILKRGETNVFRQNKHTREIPFTVIFKNYDDYDDILEDEVDEDGKIIPAPQPTAAGHTHLFRLVFNSDSPPHQLIAFAYINVLGEKNRWVVARLADYQINFYLDLLAGELVHRGIDPEMFEGSVSLLRALALQEVSAKMLNRFHARLVHRFPSAKSEILESIFGEMAGVANRRTGFKKLEEFSKALSKGIDRLELYLLGLAIPCETVKVELVAFRAAVEFKVTAVLFDAEIQRAAHELAATLPSTSDAAQLTSHWAGLTKHLASLRLDALFHRLEKDLREKSQLPGVVVEAYLDGLRSTFKRNPSGKDVLKESKTKAAHRHLLDQKVAATTFFDYLSPTAEKLARFKGNAKLLLAEEMTKWCGTIKKKALRDLDGEGLDDFRKWLDYYGDNPGGDQGGTALSEPPNPDGDGENPNGPNQPEDQS